MSSRTPLLHRKESRVPSKFFLWGHHFVHDSVFLGIVGAHEEIAFRVFLDLLYSLPGVHDEDIVESLAKL